MATYYDSSTAVKGSAPQMDINAVLNAGNMLGEALAEPAKRREEARLASQKDELFARNTELFERDTDKYNQGLEDRAKKEELMRYLSDPGQGAYDTTNLEEVNALTQDYYERAKAEGRELTDLETKNINDLYGDKRVQATANYGKLNSSILEKGLRDGVKPADIASILTLAKSTQPSTEMTKKQELDYKQQQKLNAQEHKARVTAQFKTTTSSGKSKGTGKFLKLPSGLTDSLLSSDRDDVMTKMSVSKDAGYSVSQVNNAAINATNEGTWDQNTYEIALASMQPAGKAKKTPNFGTPTGVTGNTDIVDMASLFDSYVGRGSTTTPTTTPKGYVPNPTAKTTLTGGPEDYGYGAYEPGKAVTLSPAAQIIAGFEGGSGDTAGKYTGVGQFAEGTAAPYLKVMGYTHEDYLKNPEIQKQVLNMHTNHNADQLRKMNIKADGTSLFAMHNLGSGDGPKVLKGQPLDQKSSYRVLNQLSNKQIGVDIPRYAKTAENDSKGLTGQIDFNAVTEQGIDLTKIDAGSLWLKKFSKGAKPSTGNTPKKKAPPTTVDTKTNKVIDNISGRFTGGIDKLTELLTSGDAAKSEPSALTKAFGNNQGEQRPLPKGVTAEDLAFMEAQDKGLVDSSIDFVPAAAMGKYLTKFAAKIPAVVKTATKAEKASYKEATKILKSKEATIEAKIAAKKRLEAINAKKFRIKDGPIKKTTNQDLTDILKKTLDFNK